MCVVQVYMCEYESTLFFFFFFFKFYFIFKLYIIVLVLPNIKMNPEHMKALFYKST